MFQFPEFAPCSYEFTAKLLSFLIQKSPGHSLVADSPRLIAGSHVFRRFLMPRHPPYTLSSLTTFIDHRHEIANCRFAIAELLRHAPIVNRRSHHRARWDV